MNYWTKFAEAQTERLRLQKKVFDLMCSIQLLEAEKDLAPEEQILKLKATFAAQQAQMNRDISCQLLALEQLKTDDSQRSF